MRFKKFNDIENIRHAKVEEKPIKHYTGNIDEVHCSSPSKNTSAATKKEMVEMQGMFKQRNKAIEQSVKNHDPKSEYAIEKYLKENNLELNLYSPSFTTRSFSSSLVKIKSSSPNSSGGNLISMNSFVQSTFRQFVSLKIIDLVFLLSFMTVLP